MNDNDEQAIEEHDRIIDAAICGMLANQPDHCDRVLKELALVRSDRKFFARARWALHKKCCKLEEQIESLRKEASEERFARIHAAAKLAEVAGAVSMLLTFAKKKE